MESCEKYRKCFVNREYNGRGKGYKINDKYRRDIGGKWNSYTDDELSSDL